ncbi:MAG TPA: DUF2092 domain-containing protein [Thermoanaerobaculia bacterium]|nr:DUF2092 domain-containing protein [Thermoanaerobaculia bacterium]
MRTRARNRFVAAWGALGALLLGLDPSAASTEAAALKPATAPVATPAPPPPLEPEALAQLKAMSDLLKDTARFTFKATADREQPSVNGPMLDFFSVSQVAVSRPNQLRVETKGDLHAASLWYDGKMVTIYSLKSSFYGQTAAPATIDETVLMLMDRFQMPLPAAGFLLKDPYSKMMEGVKTAFDAGDAEIDGVACRHLAFSEEDADWQVWVEKGAKPLPRRIAVTYKKIQGAPRVVSTLSDWNLSPKIAAGEFTFSPPAGAKKVDWKTSEK